MSVTQIYHIVKQAMRQLRPDERITRLRVSVWMIVGIYLSKAVHLRKIAGKIPGAATTNSKIRRLSRFLDNSAVNVREWYEPQARAVLEAAAQHHGRIRLIVDGSKVGFGHQLLMVGLAYRRRALPIAWTWIKSARGHSSAHKQKALLAYVRSLIPAHTPVLVVGDSEFGAGELLKQLDTWKWAYVLRQKSSHLVKLAAAEDWQAFGTLAPRPGTTAWHPKALLTQHHAYQVNLYVVWQKGYAEPWLLATNLATPRQARRAYRRRVWIEEMFGDLKGHGFDLESSHLRHFMRLSRLTLLVVILYMWLITRGSQVIKWGQRRLVDRADRVDLSVFHIGLCMFERYITNQQAFTIRWIPYFHKLSGS